MTSNYIAPSIKVIENGFSKCDELIQIVQTLPDEAWHDSYIQMDGMQHNAGIRNSKEINISYGLDRPRVFFDLAQVIFANAGIYARENGFEFSHMEGVNLLNYEPNQGFYDRHADAGPKYPRSMSVIVYLNDVEVGGETWFDKFGISIKPERGKIVLFPANFPYSHQAMPPESGNKYIAVTWFGEKIDQSVFGDYFQ